MAITLYRSNYAEFDSSTNGGDITTTQIESGVANSFLVAVRPREAELGAVRWFKYFVKTDTDIITIGVDIAKLTTCPTEKLFFAKETKDDHSDVEDDLDKDNIRLYGGFTITDIDADNKKVTADIDVSDFVKANDNVTFYDDNFNRLTLMIVDSVDEKDITFKVWSDITLSVGNVGSSTLYYEKLNADDYIGIWIKEPIEAYTKAMEDPLNEFGINVWSNDL